MTFLPWLNADFVDGYLTSQRWGEGGWLGRNRFLLCGNIVFGLGLVYGLFSYPLFFRAHTE